MWGMEEGAGEGEREGGGPEPTNGISTDPLHLILLVSMEMFKHTPK